MAQVEVSIQDANPPHNGDRDLEDDEMPLQSLFEFLGTGLNINEANKLEDMKKSRTPPSKRRWKKALKKTREVSDPWAQFHLEDIPEEKCVRHRYNANSEQWSTDECVVKIANQPFANGAMRECFRMKKLSNFSRSKDWKHASNYVAKIYMEPVERDVYFQDVKLQNDAKVWGEEYNRHNPPKKVDICQMAILEFVDRPGKPLYHLEHFMEGHYVKYNSNSGFVADEALRCTPQAFSHFTFERSGHKLIVVDIQGVGDLYTDPQIHTSTGTEYNEGNLGTKGMALFFATHTCNEICLSLGLTIFDLHPTELEDHAKYVQLSNNSDTHVRKEDKIQMVYRPRFSISPLEITRYLITERLMSESSDGNGVGNGLDALDEDEREDDTSESDASMPSTPTTPVPMKVTPLNAARIRFRSENSESESSMTKLSESVDADDDEMSLEEERRMFLERKVAHRPSCVNMEVELRKDSTVGESKSFKSILGLIHLDLAKYHELGRFAATPDSRNMKAALYHLEQAANCLILEAIVASSRIYLNLPHDVLTDLEMEENEANHGLGIDYMEMAAEAGDRASMIFMARAFDTGNGLGTDREKSWPDAINWYEQAVEMSSEDDDGDYDSAMCDPTYTLIARQAEMYREGGCGLCKDPTQAAEMYNEAAEAAMAAMKGRMANRFYMLSEECYGEVEEEEEDDDSNE